MFISLRATVILASLSAATTSGGVFDEKLTESHHAAATFPNLSQGATCSAGKPTVSWVRRERNGPSDPWSTSKNAYSARYALVSLGSRLAGQEVFLAGVLPDGKSVIEKWEFPKKKGRLVMSTTSPPPPIGTPAGAWTAPFALHGQVLRMSPMPPTWFPPTISVLMESSSYGVIRSIDVDPEGRFVLFSRYPEGDVYSLDLSQSASTPTMLFSSAQIPELRALGELSIEQHEALGRVCIVEPGDPYRACQLTSPPPVVLLIDGNNDGMFEATQVMPLDDYLTSRELDASDHTVWSSPWRLGQ